MHGVVSLILVETIFLENLENLEKSGNFVKSLNFILYFDRFLSHFISGNNFFLRFFKPFYDHEKNEFSKNFAASRRCILLMIFNLISANRFVILAYLLHQFFFSIGIHAIFEGFKFRNDWHVFSAFNQEMMFFNHKLLCLS
jgi:hypothetical protein